jgi:hypothetical protein
MSDGTQNQHIIHFRLENLKEKEYAKDPGRDGKSVKMNLNEEIGRVKKSPY